MIKLRPWELHSKFFQVLDLMKEVAEEVAEDNEETNCSNGSDYSGYHSDSDSTVMMSGNSPFISKMARYNFLSRSGKKTWELHCGLSGEPYHHNCELHYFPWYVHLHFFKSASVNEVFK